MVLGLNYSFKVSYSECHTQLVDKVACKQSVIQAMKLSSFLRFQTIFDVGVSKLNSASKLSNQLVLMKQEALKFSG
jgi:hypothetical protein